MAVAQASSDAFAATWRDDQGKVVGHTYGGTMCWFPRKPWRLRIVREDLEHIVRCRECPGCLEFERRRLAERMRRRYSDLGARLFLVRIYAPADHHASLSHKLHRRPTLELEPGFWRLGATSFGVLSSSPAEIAAVLRSRGIEFRIERIQLKRGRRAWRGITGGLLVQRAVYGEQQNRWYARGLPPAEREQWEVVKRGYQKGYQRASSPRAWKGRRLILVPPEVWRLRRADRRVVRGMLGEAVSPEGVARVMGVVGDYLERASGSAINQPAGRPVLSDAGLSELYASRGFRNAVRPKAERTDDSSSPPSQGGGYASSSHSSGAPPPKLADDAALMERGESGRPRWMERMDQDAKDRTVSKDSRRERTLKWIEEWAERVARKAKEVK